MTLRKLAAAVALLGSLLGVAGCGADKGADAGAKTQIVLGRFVGPFVLQAGMSMNAFEDIDLKATDIDSGPAALPLIARGSLSGADGISEPPLVTSFERDLGLKIVWATNVSPHSFLVRPDIKKPADLRGKKIAAPGGSILQVELAQYLAEHGMAMSDIRFVDLDAASIVSSYTTGAIDGAFLWQPQASTVEEKGARKLATSVGTSFDVFSGRFVDEHPEAVQAFVCDMADVQKKFLADPEPSWQALAKELDLDQKTVQQLLPKDAVYPPDEMTTKVLGPDGEAVDRMVRAGTTMVELDQVEKAPEAKDVQGMIDTRFAKAVESGKCPS